MTTHPKYKTDGDDLAGWVVVMYLTAECALLNYNNAAQIYGFEQVDHMGHYPNKFFTRIGPRSAIYLSDGQWVGLMEEGWQAVPYGYSGPEGLPYGLRKLGAQIEAPPASERLKGALQGAILGALPQEVVRGMAGSGRDLIVKKLRKEKKS